MPTESTKPKIRKAVIADAGYATRFFPITKTLPKSMLPILDKPITHYVIEECVAAGITEVIIVATEEGKPIYEDYFHNTVQHIHEQLARHGRSQRFEKISQVFNLPNIIVIAQNKDLPYGNGTPALCARPYIGDEPFLYLYSDDLVTGTSACKELVDMYNQSEDDVAAVVGAKKFDDIDVTKYGIFKIKEGTADELEQSVEKPSLEQAPNPPYLITFGRYLFTNEIYNYLEPKKENLGRDDELWMNDAINRLAQAKKVRVKNLTGNWTTTGDPTNYLQTAINMAIQHPDYNGVFKKYLTTLMGINKE